MKQPISSDTNHDCSGVVGTLRYPAYSAGLDRANEENKRIAPVRPVLIADKALNAPSFGSADSFVFRIDLTALACNSDFKSYVCMVSPTIDVAGISRAITFDPYCNLCTQQYTFCICPCRGTFNSASIRALRSDLEVQVHNTKSIQWIRAVRRLDNLVITPTNLNAPSVSDVTQSLPICRPF
ncbi:hypothetical protein PoB_002954600 [Plakobranchus ocellatus]|uniref:Phlebovirus glycoprotein G2 fusion domain-containing protein n=1 Tax=Plakobranchus ocellatus TaxID=259542 RepID=A0AAV3ZVP9_9GAST|nr:hypothetical protein PoB_002954600 [Plakobranchus ocellatus]